MTDLTNHSIALRPERDRLHAYATTSIPIGRAMGILVDSRYVTDYALIMIQSIRHKGLNRLYRNDDPRGLLQEHREKLSDILVRLDAASTIKDMELPGFRLHPLQGDLRDFWAVTVRANWRVIFRFVNGDAWDVDYVDYH